MSADEAKVREAVALGVRELADWAAGVTQNDIPPAILGRAARVLADDMAAIVGARDEPEVARFHERTLARAALPEATVFRGGTRRCDRIGAAVANAVAADWLELDEGYRPTPCHGGLYVLPALMAEAEAIDLPFGEMLRALVLGYEMVTRIARTWTPQAMTMQSHGRYAAVGAAAGVALARGKTGAEIAEAIGAAATLIGPSPRNHLAAGILVRNVWPAAGAWSGMMAVDWAECGIVGVPGAFHDVYGTVLGGRAHPERLAAGLGQSWALQDGYTKIYACCQHLHSAVEAAIGLRDQVLAHGTLDNIASIAVETHALALPLINPAPHTTLAAKFSMSHAMAAVLVTGSGGAEAFAATTLALPAIASLRPHVSVTRWAPELPPPNDRPARVTVALRDGRTLAAECLSAQGGPDRPLPPETALLKLAALAGPAYPRMPQVFGELTALGSPRMAQGWKQIVAEMTQ